VLAVAWNLAVVPESLDRASGEAETADGHFSDGLLRCEFALAEHGGRITGRLGCSPPEVTSGRPRSLDGRGADPAAPVMARMLRGYPTASGKNLRSWGGAGRRGEPAARTGGEPGQPAEGSRT
jgi:hypothetical protein